MNKLPEFRPITRSEMRRMWAEPRADDVRRLTLEVERYRRVMREIDQLYRTIHESCGATRLVGIWSRFTGSR